MKLNSLTIALRKTFHVAGPDNPYEAKLSISYNENTMQVALSPEVCQRILQLAGDEIARAAQVQIRDFITSAIAINTMPLIEAPPNSFSGDDEVPS